MGADARKGKERQPNRRLVRGTSSSLDAEERYCVQFALMFAMNVNVNVKNICRRRRMSRVRIGGAEETLKTTFIYHHITSNANILMLNYFDAVGWVGQP